MSAAFILASAIESDFREKRLVEAFESLVEAYFNEYEDATEIDPVFERSLRNIFDTVFQHGAPDDREFEDFIKPPEGR